MDQRRPDVLRTAIVVAVLALVGTLVATTIITAATYYGGTGGGALTGNDNFWEVEWPATFRWMKWVGVMAAGVMFWAIRHDWPEDDE